MHDKTKEIEDLAEEFLTTTRNVLAQGGEDPTWERIADVLATSAAVLLLSLEVILLKEKGESLADTGIPN